MIFQHLVLRGMLIIGGILLFIAGKLGIPLTEENKQMITKWCDQCESFMVIDEEPTDLTKPN